MQKRKIDELISHFNRKVADMDIDREYKMELLGMITAIGIACEKEISIEPERKTGKWIMGKCDQCGAHAPFWPMASTYYESDYCPNCGARMEGEA